VAVISWKKTTSLNPKADEEVVAAKKEIEIMLARYRESIATEKLSVNKSAGINQTMLNNVKLL
jgi:putative transposase